MKSRVEIKSHHIHPMLMALPIGLWAGSLAYDLCDLATDDSGDGRLRQSADDMMLAGFVGALAAAIPGIVDYLAVVPPESSAKGRAARHGMINVGLAALYGINWLLRTRSPARWGRRLGTPLSMLGFGGLMYSGWLGGTLVYRNQIGVDHRGPNAAKWRESGRLKGEPGTPVTVGTMAEFEKPGQMKLVHLNGHRIAVMREGDRIVAFQDRCTHRGGPLTDGVLACNTITCPWHGSQFSVDTGEVVSGPAEEKIRVYPVRVEGEVIRVVAPEPNLDATIEDESGLLPTAGMV
ncbi:MAG: Rieske 2Fe-2S domain-containing protein [Armatimonadetes bacterium]|nr:Rieske 2Fe-2S domain-containing protein [Armatimonadota bacterium]